MDALLSLIPGGTVTAVLAAVAGVLFAIWRAFSAGKTSERAKRSEERLEAVKDKKEIDDEVDALSPADVDARFKRWMQDDR